jgi:hypothetical protein
MGRTIFDWFMIVLGIVLWIALVSIIVIPLHYYFGMLSFWATYLVLPTPCLVMFFATRESWLEEPAKAIFCLSICSAFISGAIFLNIYNTNVTMGLLLTAFQFALFLVLLVFTFSWGMAWLAFSERRYN